MILPAFGREEEVYFPLAWDGHLYFTAAHLQGPQAGEM